MRRKALLMAQRKQEPLIIEIDTRNLSTGSSDANTFTIPTASGGTYYYRVDWGDGTVTNAHTGNASHTYINGGIYEVKITGKFPKFYFNNTGDRLKILKIQDWGKIKYSTNQDNAFWGCNNLDYIAKDDINAWYNGIVSASSMFRNCPLTTIPDNMTLDNLVNGDNTFATSIHQGLTALPIGMTLANLTNGTSMFYGNSLTSLPDGMTLSNLTTGNSMFYNNSLTSLPDGMTLSNLTNGNQMFYNNSLTSLPDVMTLSNLTNGSQMFRDNSLTSLPDGMTLSSLTTGSQMFRDNSLTSLPDGMTLSSLTTGNSMFYNNSLTSLPASISLISVTDLTAFVRDNPNFSGTINVGTTPLISINALGWGNKFDQDMSGWNFTPNCSFGNVSFNPAFSNYSLFSSENYGKLISRIRNQCVGTGRTAAKVLGVHSSVKYPASAAADRADLVADGWTIVDGGLE